MTCVRFIPSFSDMSQPTSHGGASDATLYDFAQAAETLRVTESWLRRAVTAKKIPHRRVGRVVRFSNADLAAIVAASAVAVAGATNELRPSRRSA